MLDGAPAEENRPALLAAADVLRADEQETHLLTGAPPDDPSGVRAAADKLLAAGPGLLALGVRGGNLFLWRDGHALLPQADTPVVDTTGAGDALTAALTVALLRGDPPEQAARYAVAAAAATVGHAGGRPRLSDTVLREHITETLKPSLDPASLDA